MIQYESQFDSLGKAMQQLTVRGFEPELADCIRRLA